MKVVACNLVSNTLGTVNPAVRLGEWAHERGAIMVVDAAQAAPHRPLDVQALGCDFLALSSHKMCGPSGSGALWGAASCSRDVPLQPRRRDDPLRLLEKTTWNELPYKFEAGTPAIAEAVGFGAAAVDYVTEVGLDAIERHEHELLEYTLGRLGEIPGSTSTGLLPSGAPASCRSTSTACTRTTWPRCSTGKAWPSARATLHAAADDQAGRQRDDAGELLPARSPRRSTASWTGSTRSRNRSGEPCGI